MIAIKGKEEDEEMVEYVHKPEEIVEKGKPITFENKTGLNNLLEKEIKKLKDMLTPASNLGENEKFAVRYCILILKGLSVKAEPEQRYDEWCTDCKEYDHERHCCPRWNRVIRETLNDAQPRWIPVSERQPKKMGAYMTTVYYGKYGIASGQRYYYGQNLWNDDCVIAWMPLPEPYKEEIEKGADL